MRSPAKKGSVVLVALSCVTVLGIAMASFLAISSQAMKFSNRSYAKAVSKQLAEMGLERALRSYNAGTFSSGWTLTGGTTATRSLSISSSHYGNSGIAATVNIRVEHYRTTNKATVWSELTAYSANDFVWYQGVWYLCTAAPPVAVPPLSNNQVPSNTTYWKAAPETWNAQANYRIGNIALSGGSAYRCIANNINQTPPNATYWTAYSAAAWSSGTAYAVDTVVLSGGLHYRCIAANTDQEPPNTTYWLSAPVIYAEGVATLPDNTATTLKTQLRTTLAPASLFPNALAATTLVTFASTGTVNSYNSPLGTYNQTTAPFSASSPNIGSSAVVAGGNTGGNAVALTNVRVNGYLAAPSASTSPYAPRYTNSTSGIVTSTPAPTTPATKIDLTRISRSPYIPQFDIQNVTGGGNLPAAAGGGTYLDTGTNTLGTAGATTPSIYNIDGTYNGTSLYSGLYLDIATNILNIDGPVILNVSGPLYIYSGKINITTRGSLEVYFTGQLYVGSSATTGIQNATLDPKKCLLVGTSTGNSSGSHYYWANGAAATPFYGLIYMPNAYVSTWTNVVIRGAISAKNIGYPQAGCFLNYDTSLRTAGAIGTFIDAPYKLTEWRELTDPNDKITLP
jgi:hypothetical protein